jgi:hypothetical protein
MTYEYGIGIDPGWKNLGLAVVCREVGKEDIQLVHSSTLNPAELGGILPTLKKICELVEPLLVGADRVCTGIERYVAYGDTVTHESENILMMIGALVVGMNYFNKATDGTKMVRAIEWKTGLVKALFKWKKFNNPSTKLDKKFSVAAAESILEGVKVETNHESDAICIAALPFIPGFK